MTVWTEDSSNCIPSQWKFIRRKETKGKIPRIYNCNWIYKVINLRKRIMGTFLATDPRYSTTEDSIQLEPPMNCPASKWTEHPTLQRVGCSTHCRAMPFPGTKRNIFVF